MTQRIERDAIYRGRRYSSETIELCIRWYISYRLSYRNLSAMMAEQNISVSHTTIMRWVLHYLPEYERRWARFARTPGSSWRMDETAVNVRGGKHYLYRAVDKNGKSIGSLLCYDRTWEAADAFFRSAVAQKGIPWPRKINIDGSDASLRALRTLGKEDSRWRSVEIRQRRYLNNVVEQDHRAIKQRCASMLGLKSFRSAEITLAGIELAHRIRKGQYAVPCEGRGAGRSLKTMWDAALNGSTELDEPPPPMHQNSRARRGYRTNGRRDWGFGRVRYQRRLSFGNGLSLLVMPRGGQYWQYQYRFEGRRRVISYGVYPDVSADRARLRHQAARTLLAAGLDPMLMRKELQRDGRLSI